MNRNILYGLWAGLYIVCAGLGFIPEPAGFGKAVLVLMSILFFIPPMVLLYRGDIRDLKFIRNISILWLVGALVLLVGNLLSVLASEAFGTGLYALLVLLTAPMVCGQYWLLSLFLWACLLMGSLSILKKK